MKPAVVIVDMLKDTLEGAHPMPIKELGREIVPAINRLTDFARGRSIPVIFSMDSFLPGDFIFQGKMKNHSIRGTKGAEVTDLLTQAADGHLFAQAALQRFLQDGHRSDASALRGRHGRALRHCHPLVRPVVCLRRPLERFPRGHRRGLLRQLQPRDARKLPRHLPQEPTLAAAAGHDAGGLPGGDGRG